MKGLFTAITVLALATNSAAQPLHNQTIIPYLCSNCSNLSHETLQKQWAIEANSMPFETLSNRQKSFSYKKIITARELEKGVAIATSAPGAVIRLVPKQEEALPPLHIITAKKQKLSLKEASTLYSENTSFEGRSDTDSKQTVLQLKSHLGKGDFIVSTNQNLKPNAIYTLSMFEKNSPVFLQVETDAIHYHYGDKVTVTILINEGSYESHDLNAFVIDSKEQKIPLTLTKIKANTFQSTFNLNSMVNVEGKNWHVEVDTVGGYIKRSGHCAFSYTIPSATFLQIEKMPLNPLSFTTQIEVATASRYAVEAVLFQKNSGTPLKAIQKAQWLEPGVHQIELSFENLPTLKADEVQIGYLRLIDYGQLKLVHQVDGPLLP